MKYAAAFNLALILIIFVERGSAEIVWDSFDSPNVLVQFDPAVHEATLWLETSYPGPAQYRKTIFRHLDQFGGRSEGTFIEIANGAVTGHATDVFSIYTVDYGGSVVIDGQGFRVQLDLDLDPKVAWEVDYTLSTGDAAGVVPVVMVMRTWDRLTFKWPYARLGGDAIVSDDVHTMSFPVSQFTPVDGFSLDDVDAVSVELTAPFAANSRPVHFEIHEIRLVPEPSIPWLFAVLVPFLRYFKTARS